MDQHTPTRGRGYQNLMLTAIAGLLVLGAIDRRGDQGAAALAQPQSDGGLSNALEQRKQMITELRSLNTKFERLEAKINSGLSVKVTEMPPIKINDQRGKADNGQPESKPSIEVRPAPGK